MYFVHALNGIIDQQPGNLWCHGQMKSQEESQRGCIEVTGAEHRAGIAALSSTTVAGLQDCFHWSGRYLGDRECWDKRLFRSEPDKKVSPDAIEVLIEHMADNRRPSFTRFLREIFSEVDDEISRLLGLS
jgi:hypothetical protein